MHHQLTGGPKHLGDGAATSTRVVLRAPRGVFFVVVRRSPRHDGGQPFRLGRGRTGMQRHTRHADAVRG